MKIRKILIFIILILLTGCSSEYTLKVSNNKFEEDINVIIPKSIIPVETSEHVENEYDLDDQITPFIEGKTYSLTGSEKFYKKKSIEYNDYFNVIMNYAYDENEFQNADSVNLCFEYPEFDFSETYYINLQGTFYCLYTDSIDIKIVTDNKVSFNNADEVRGNTYIWHIDQTNEDYVDIKIDIDKGASRKIIYIVIVGVIFVTTILFVGYKLYIKYKENNSI